MAFQRQGRVAELLQVRCQPQIGLRFGLPGKDGFFCMLVCWNTVPTPAQQQDLACVRAQDACAALRKNRMLKYRSTVVASAPRRGKDTRLLLHSDPNGAAHSDVAILHVYVEVDNNQYIAISELQIFTAPGPWDATCD
jgi:hypothetical protein